MQADLLEHPEDWENHTLARFLDALAAVLEALPLSYQHQGRQLPDPSWALFAQALVCATGYE
jgi:hypothetical protein